MTSYSPVVGPLQSQNVLHTDVESVIKFYSPTALISFLKINLMLIFVKFTLEFCETPRIVKITYMTKFHKEGKFSLIICFTCISITLLLDQVGTTSS